MSDTQQQTAESGPRIEQERWWGYDLYERAKDKGGVSFVEQDAEGKAIWGDAERLISDRLAGREWSAVHPGGEAELRAGLSEALGALKAAKGWVIDHDGRRILYLREVIKNVERALAPGWTRFDAAALPEPGEVERLLRELANGVLDHYFHRRATHLLRDRTLEAAMQRLHRALSSHPEPTDPPINRNLYYEGHRDGWNAALGFLDSDEAIERVEGALESFCEPNEEAAAVNLTLTMREAARSVLAVIRGGDRRRRRCFCLSRVAVAAMT